MQALRAVITQHVGAEPPPVPSRPAIERYGRVALKDSVPLFDAVPELFSGDGVFAAQPEPMEEYGQRCVWGGGLAGGRVAAAILSSPAAGLCCCPWQCLQCRALPHGTPRLPPWALCARSAGLILYRTWLPEGALSGKDGHLDLGAPVHDYASIYLGGRLVGRLDRSDGSHVLTLPAQHPGTQQGRVTCAWLTVTTRLRAPPPPPSRLLAADQAASCLQLEILVEAFGHQNFGCDTGGCS